MKLYENQQQRIRLGWRTYRLRLTYDRVLSAMDVASDPALTDSDRQRVMLRLLVRSPLPRNPKMQHELLEKIFALLEDTGSHRSGGKALTSMTQDAPLIHAAFRQAYGLDLRTQRIPWQTFCDYFIGLPSDTKLAEVISLRARPIPPPTRHNARERAALMEAKQAVALHLEGEAQLASYYQGTQAMLRIMLDLAKRGDSHE
ncbi:MAG: hypothetical protein IJ350_00200 [Clostridia bacterium]|nr:hypothetical protein [Clostridia bacterium]